MLGGGGEVGSAFSFRQGDPGSIRAFSSVGVGLKRYIKRRHESEAYRANHGPPRKQAMRLLIPII